MDREAWDRRRFLKRAGTAAWAAPVLIAVTSSAAHAVSPACLTDCNPLDEACGPSNQCGIVNPEGGGDCITTGFPPCCDESCSGGPFFVPNSPCFCSGLG